MMFLTALLLLPLSTEAADPKDPSVENAPGRPAVRGKPAVDTSVFYLTNRRLREHGEAGEAYGGERGGRAPVRLCSATGWAGVGGGARDAGDEKKRGEAIGPASLSGDRLVRPLSRAALTRRRPARPYSRGSRRSGR